MKTLSLISLLMLSISVSAQEAAVPDATTTSKTAFENIRLFPNPTSEVIFIRNGELIDSYRILDMQGRVVQEGIRNAQVISLIDIPSGFYFIEMKIGDAIEKVRVQKY